MVVKTTGKHLDKKQKIAIMVVMQTTPIELELRKLGLKEKEVKVYLAGLELGPSSAQDIAKQAGISRPTAYEIIKALERKGLFAEAKREKRRYFTAQSPAHILGVLRIQKREIEEKEREFIRIIAALESKYSLKEKGGVKIYKDKEGLEVLEEVFSFATAPEIFVFSSQAEPKVIKNRETIYLKIKKRLGKIEVKEILPQKAKPKPGLPQVQRKFFSCPGLKGTLILSDKAIFLPSQKPEGFLIENELIVNLLKILFLSLWESV